MAIQLAAGTVDAINTHKRAKKFTRKLPPGPCPEHGSKEHWRSECPHKNATCLVCHRMGHLTKVCRDKNSTTNDTGGNNPRRQAQSKSNQNHKTHLIEMTNEELAINEPLQILETHMTPHQREVAIVNAKLNGHSVNIQLDTGATVTLLAETTWKILIVLNCNPLISNFKPSHSKKFLTWDNVYLKFNVRGGLPNCWLLFPRVTDKTC